MRRLGRAPAADDEVDLSPVQLQLQVVAGELVTVLTQEGLGRRVPGRGQVGDGIGVVEEDIDVVTDAVLVEDGKRRAAAEGPRRRFLQRVEIGRASCRERVCQYV